MSCHEAAEAEARAARAWADVNNVDDAEGMVCPVSFELRC